MTRLESLIGAVMLTALCAVWQPAVAQTHMYLDFNGETAGSGIGPGGVGFLWSTIHADYWSTSSSGTAQTQLWMDGRVAVMAAGTDCEGWGATANLASGSSAPQVAGIRVEDCLFRIGQYTLFLTGALPELYQASGLSLTINSQVNWPFSGSMKKTGPGELIFDANSGDAGTPTTTSFLIDQGLVQFDSNDSNWFGGTSSAGVTIGTNSVSATLQLLSPDQLRNRTVLDLVNGQFQMGGNDETLRGLSGSGTVNGGGANLSLRPQGGNYSFAGTITDGGGSTALTVSGYGSQTFENSQAYSGDTRIEAGGQLIVAGLANSLAEVVDGRLSVAETLNSVNVRSDGELRLGQPVGQINAQNLTWDGGGEITWQLGHTSAAMDSSTLSLSGMLNRGSEGELRIVLDPDSELPVSAESYTLIEFDSTNAALSDFLLVDNGLLAERDFNLQLTGNSLTLEVGVLDPLFSDRFESEN